MTDFFWCKIYPISAMVLMVVFICLGLSSCELDTSTEAYEKCMSDTSVLGYSFKERHDMCLVYAALNRK